MTTFVPVSRPLYITGSATPGGTDLNAATGITELSNGRLYSWRGRLVPGTFKFITEPGQEFPSYNMGDDNATMPPNPTSSLKPMKREPTASTCP